MGLTERHWFENEDVPENYEWALEDAVYNSRTNKKRDDEVRMINRDKVIKELMKLHGTKETMNVIFDAIVLLKKQEPKIGHWIDSAGADKCSVCGATYSDLYPDYQNTHYCPNCGAEMTTEVTE